MPRPGLPDRAGHAGVPHEGAAWHRGVLRVRVDAPDLGPRDDPARRRRRLRLRSLLPDLALLTLYLRLADEAGGAVPSERRKPPQLPAGWARDRGSLPQGLAPDCEAWTLRVRKEIEDLVRRVQRDFPARQVFASSAPNATLSREIADSLRACLAPGGEDLPVDVECRGSTCALAPRAGDPASAVRWKCPRDASPRGLCYGDHEADWWFARLVHCRELRKVMDTCATRSALPRRASTSPLRVFLARPTPCRSPSWCATAGAGSSGSCGR